uniref:DNA-processing protein DprA n=1 Tax=Eubacterium cellulosolvens TaxID=29322 RepID=UPI000AD8F76D|nr:DNA-processing protein DprA [[Eubacterium] cellulosolvens]
MKRGINGSIRTETEPGDGVPEGTDLQGRNCTGMGREWTGKIRCIERGTERYPEKFEGLAHMPGRLYVIGNFPDPQKKTVAIVGARGCSEYGRKEALRFGRVLAEYGVQIVSGLAYGVDAWAQKGALDGGGKTFAVLGTGVDVCYPKQNASLYRKIIREGGGILSEFEPGAPPNAWHFPLRNRIISALADVVLVVEARRKSGSLITADYAMEQGRTVYALPGRTMDELSQGCNRLIAQGAGIAWTPEIILDELGICTKEPLSSGAETCSPAGLCGTENGRKIKNLEISSFCDRTCDENDAKEDKNPAKKGENIRIGRRGEKGKQAEKDRRNKKKQREWPHAHDFETVYSRLEIEPRSLQKLHELTGMNIADLSSVLMQLCISGYAEEVTPGFFCRS